MHPISTIQGEREVYIGESDLLRLRLVLSSARAQAEFEGGTPRPHLEELARALHRPRIIKPGQCAPEVVTMHSRLRIRDGDHAWTMRLVFPEDADPESGQISVLAPLGAAVLGRAPGERVRFFVGDGEPRSCGIVSILYQPEKIRGIHGRTVGCR